MVHFFEHNSHLCAGPAPHSCLQNTHPFILLSTIITSTQFYSFLFSAFFTLKRRRRRQRVGLFALGNMSMFILKPNNGLVEFLEDCDKILICSYT